MRLPQLSIAYIYMSRVKNLWKLVLVIFIVIIANKIILKNKTSPKYEE
jgi:hypothetical protein